MRKRWIVLIVLGVLLVGGGLVVWLMRAPAPPERDYGAELVALADSYAPWTIESERAIDAMLAAHARIEAIELQASEAEGAELARSFSVEQALDREPPDSADLNPDETLAERALARRALELYDASSMLTPLRTQSRVRARVEPVQLLYARDLQWFRPLRAVARYEGVRMRVAAREGDAAEAVEALQNQLAFSRIGSSDPSLIGALVGIAIESFARQSLQQSIEDGDIDAALARRMLEVIDAHAAEVPASSYAFASERLALLDGINAAYEGRIDTQLMQQMPHPTLLSLVVSHGAMYAKANEIMDGIDALAAATPRERLQLTSPDEMMDALSIRFALLGTLVPAATRAIGAFDEVDLYRDAMRIMLALEVYRDEQGGYPASLDALVPDILAALPTDPFASDGQFRYVLLASEPKTLPLDMPYALYSVGLDGLDSGGESFGKEPREFLREFGGDVLLNAKTKR
jgi:hypothetical protein